MDTMNKPEDMILDEIFAEILRLNQALGNAQVLVFLSFRASSRYDDYRSELEERIAALFDEIRRRVCEKQ